jgi:hypothetical protein
VLPDPTEEAIESLQWHAMVDMLIDDETKLKHWWWMGIGQADFPPLVGVLDLNIVMYLQHQSTKAMSTTKPV